MGKRELVQLGMPSTRCGSCACCRRASTRDIATLLTLPFALPVSRNS